MTGKEKKRLKFDRQLVGFVGLGVMGQPMALNLVRAGTPLVVWNRTPEATKPLKDAGACVAADVEELFARASTVILMLRNEDALDDILRRGTKEFPKLVAEHLIVSMGSNSPGYSRALGLEIEKAGGRYVEAPVSGSRKPAEAGQLVAMAGGDGGAIAEIRPLLAFMCREILVCGAVGDALLMKLAVNLYLNTTIAALAEAVHFARRCALNLETFEAVVGAGALASDVTRVKIPKLVSREYSVQAATADAFNSTCLIAEAARELDIATPLLDLSSSLYGESIELGNGGLDMSSVMEAIESRPSPKRNSGSISECIANLRIGP
jgi:3-hydroxyisobutyrate dehydrogenase